MASRLNQEDRTLLVCGQGAFSDVPRIARVVEQCIRRKGIVRIACTGGMEKHVLPVASRLGVECSTYRAEYRRFGPVGAIVRNVKMLEDAQPAIVIGFTDTLDDNTIDLLRRAAKSRIATYLVSTKIVAPVEDRGPPGAPHGRG